MRSKLFTECLKFPPLAAFINTSRTLSYSFNATNLIRFSTVPINCSETSSSAFLHSFYGIVKNASSLFQAELLHCRAIKVGVFPLCGKVAGALVGLYLRCGSLYHALKLFDELTERDVRIWTILISGCCRLEKYRVGLSLVAAMLDSGTLPNRFTLANVFNCCAGVNGANNGKEVHAWVLRNGIDADVVLENSVLDFYVKIGAFEYAKKHFKAMTERDFVSLNIMIGAMLETGDINGSMELFTRAVVHDVSTWNTLINGHMRNGLDMRALQLIYDMMQIGFRFNQVTFSICLVLASRLALLELGKQIHSQVLRNGFEEDKFIMNTLVDMYCKCGKIETSVLLFNSYSPCDGKFVDVPSCQDNSIAKTILWSSMIAGYAQNGKQEKAFELFCEMLKQGNELDHFTLTTVASACSHAGLLLRGRMVHACVEKVGLATDLYLLAAIVDMYSRCGSLKEAHNVFKHTPRRNMVLWTSIVGAYASHGQGLEAIRLFQKMLEEKIVPNEISFLNVLSACSHGGLVPEGLKYFRQMQEDYKLVPSREHFSCMVDLYGRLGLISEAMDFINENNIGHLAAVWKTLLSACRVHNNIDIAKVASEQLIRLQPRDPSSYILLSNVYATKRQWLESSELRDLMQERSVRKEPGGSWI